MKDEKTAGLTPPAWPDLPTMPGTLKSSRRLALSTVQMSPLADCMSCEWATTATPSAMAQAIDHAQETGHSVLVDEITRTAVDVIR